MFYMCALQRSCGSSREPLTLPRRVRRSRSMRVWRRRHSMQRPLLTTILGAGLAMAVCGTHAQDKLKVGFMLPYTGTYAALGTAIENGFRLYVQEAGGKLGGRQIEYVKVDDESDPSKATDNVNRLIKRFTLSVAFEGSDSSSTLTYSIWRPPSLQPASCT